MGLAACRLTLDAWLAGRQYSPKTVLDTHSDLLRAEKLVESGKALPESLRPAVRRLEAAAADTGDAALLHISQTLTPRLPARGVSPRFRGNAAKQEARGREARSFEDEPWDKLLVALLGAQDPASLVLLVMSRTGLRIGDVLRLTRVDVQAAQKTGALRVIVKGGKEARVLLSGAPDEWALFSKAFLGSGTGFRDVAHWVSPGCGRTIGASAAYQRVRRKLVLTTAAVGITEKVWTHRIRRTVGVRAYRVTEDVLAVRDLLQHSSPKTTLGYLSEARPDRVADLQQKIREKIT